MQGLPKEQIITKYVFCVFKITMIDDSCALDDTTYIQNRPTVNGYARYHPQPMKSDDVKVCETNIDGYGDLIDKNGFIIDTIDINKALDDNKLTYYNETTKVAAIPLIDYARLYLQTDRILWIVDTKQHPFAENSCEMINSPLFEPNTYGAWLSSSVAIVRQIPCDENHECDTAVILRPGEIKTYVNSKNNIKQTIVIESISRAPETAPQHKIIFKPLWKFSDVIKLFAKELEMMEKTHANDVVIMAQFSNRFDDPNNILGNIVNNQSMLENIDNLYVLSDKFLNESSFKHFDDCFTVTKLRI